MKRIIVFILAVAMIFVCCISVSARKIVDFGDWSLTVDDDVLWLIDSYRGSDADLILLKDFGSITIMGVGDNALFNNTVVHTVTGEYPMSKVGDYAFSGAELLESVELPSTVDSIGMGAFSLCPALKSVNYEDYSVSYVAAYCFYRSGIESLTLSSAVTEIRNSAFRECALLNKLVIPDSVTSIADNAFLDSPNLVIYADPGTYAAEYASAKGIPVAIEYLVGDTDGDGNVSILDATRIQRLLVDLEVDTYGIMAVRGDCNGDGMNILDATKIQRYLAGYSIDDPIGTESLYNY